MSCLGRNVKDVVFRRGTKSHAFKEIFWWGVFIVLMVVVLFRIDVCRKRCRKWNPFLLDNLPQSSKHIYQSLSQRSGSRVIGLEPGLPPLTVHYVWCGIKPFQFRNYVSLISVIKVLKPHKIVFHYTDLPVDVEMWFEEITGNFPFLVLKMFDSNRHCFKFSPIADELDRTGGIYVEENVVLTSFSAEISINVTNSHVTTEMLIERGDIGVIIVSKKPERTERRLANGKNRMEHHHHGRYSAIPCSNKSSFNEVANRSCVRLTESLHPKDIWRTNDSFSRFVRWLVYGDHDIVKPISQPAGLIPNIAHYVLDDIKVTYLFYLSVLSTLNVADVKQVFIHGIREPTGVFWTKLKDRKDVHFVLTENYSDASELNVYFTDTVQKLWILLKYGGLLMDSNMVWLRRIPNYFQLYDTVLYVQSTGRKSRPEKLDTRIMFAARNSRFLQLLLPAIRQFHILYSSKGHVDMDTYLYHVVEMYPHVPLLVRDLMSHNLPDDCSVLLADRSTHSKRIGQHIKGPGNKLLVDLKIDSFSNQGLSNLERMPETYSQCLNNMADIILKPQR